MSHFGILSTGRGTLLTALGDVVSFIVTRAYLPFLSNVVSTNSLRHRLRRWEDYLPLTRLRSIVCSVGTRSQLDCAKLLRRGLSSFRSPDV